MNLFDVLRLIALAAIWGASFIFMRVISPVLGPFLTTDLRVIIAGLALLVYFKLIRFGVQWRQHWKEYLAIGALNTALPFTLFAFAALHIPASLSVILNSASPLFGAVFSAFWLEEKLTARKVLGLAFGFVGVSLVAKTSVSLPDPMAGWGVLACLTAAACYALGGIYIKRSAVAKKPMAIAGASQMMAGLLLLPAFAAFPPLDVFTPKLIANVLALSLICSAIAYLLYYRLIADLGPTKALTVTFLMPAFGMLWGALFLGEIITPRMVGGSLLVIAGTFLVVRSRPKR